MAARAAWTLIDPDAAERVHISLLPDDLGIEVIRVLMIVARSVIRAIAASARIDYLELRAIAWQQLAALPGDDSAAQSVRMLVTACDDAELAALVTTEMFGNTDPADIAIEFGALLYILASGFTEASGQPRTLYYDRIRQWLGA